MNLLSWSISRVLSWTIIPLGDKLLCRSSNLPESWAGHSFGFLFGLATSGVYPAANRYRRHGALLPHLFTLTCFARRQSSAVLLSVPLSVALPRPAVSRHSALWSPDFPPPYALRDTRRLSVRPVWNADYNTIKTYRLSIKNDHLSRFLHISH